MADETSDGGAPAASDEPPAPAEAPPAPGLRDRIGRARFNESVRSELVKQLGARAKKPKAGFRAAEVEFIVSEVTDTDIEQAVDAADAAEGGGAARDWFAADADLAKRVAGHLLGQILGE